MRNEFSARQLAALMVTALVAPLATACAAVSWQWILLAAAPAALYYIYIVRMTKAIDEKQSYDKLLVRAYGRYGGGILLALYWIFIVLLLGYAARQSVGSFPQDEGMPVVPLALMVIAAVTAAKGRGAVCRFGGILFLFVTALLGITLVFAARDISLAKLAPVGAYEDSILPFTIFLLPASALFLRDGISRRDSNYLPWFLMLLVLALAISLVCIGSLGLELAEKEAHPFWFVSRSISVLGVMERFEAVVSSMLAMSFCTLLACLLALGAKAGTALVPLASNALAVWLTAALGFGALWLAPMLPEQLWQGMMSIFWGILPALTLGIVRGKKIEKNENNC